VDRERIQTALLLDTLQLAVPVAIDQLLRDAPPVRYARINESAYAAIDQVCEHGDVMQMGGGAKGEAAKAFTATARGLAALAFAPGGVTFAGLHWCVEPHEHCPTGPATWGWRAHAAEEAG
jgi:hypothetical protein